MKHLAILFSLTFFWESATAQWSVQPGIGASFPITGYSTIVKTGFLYQFDAARKLKNPHWRVGLMLGWGRMHNDKSETDAFFNSRLDQVPILASADYEFSGKKIKPYAGMGLGVSLYNLVYDRLLMPSEAIFNASFSMMPRLGIRFPLDENVQPFFEVNSPFVMDGPPIGVSKGEKLTGYIGAAVGIVYYFK